MDPAAFPAETLYVVSGVTTVGVPEMVQVRERTKPAGRLIPDDNSHDVIAVPPVQNMGIGARETLTRGL